MVVFAIKNSGKNTRIKILIERIIETFNFERIKASAKPNMQKGIRILYSNIPRNLLE